MPVGSVTVQYGLACSRESPGNSPIVVPPAPCAPLHEASITPPRPPLMMTAPPSASRSPTSSAIAYSSGEAFDAPHTPTYTVTSAGHPAPRSEIASGPPAGSPDDNVDELAGHDDRLDDVLAVDVRLHVRLGQRQLAQLVLPRARGRSDAIADLAVDLADELEGVGLQERR